MFIANVIKGHNILNYFLRFVTNIKNIYIYFLTTLDTFISDHKRYILAM